MRLVQGNLPDDTYFVVDLKLSGQKGNEKIMVLVDGDDGISIDVCAEITRSLSRELENQDLFEGSYTLEVSSPGVDYPLQSKRQYLKNLGRRLRVDLVEGEVLTGELKEVNDGGIFLMVKKSKKQKEANVYASFEDIKKSKVLVAFK